MESKLFDMLGKVQVKYLDEAALRPRRAKCLKAKSIFCSQLKHLKEKGKRMMIMGKLDKQVLLQMGDYIYSEHFKEIPVTPNKKIGGQG